MRLKTKEERLKWLTKFCPEHICYWGSCGCKKPSERKLKQIAKSDF